MKLVYTITIEGDPDAQLCGAGDRSHEQRYVREPAESFAAAVERFYGVTLANRKVTVSEGRVAL